MDSVNTKIIGFWRGWSIAVGCAIGSGIFMMPTLLAPYGLIGFGGWLIAGAGSVLVALTMSRLVRRIPKTGGPYIYANEGLGHFAGLLLLGLTGLLASQQLQEFQSPLLVIWDFLSLL